MKKSINYLQIIFIVFTAVLFAQCSCPREIDMNNEGTMKKPKGNLSFETVNINCWLNLMPGTNPGSFHISGDIKIDYEEENQILDLNLYKIVIYQSDKILYSFRPFFTYNLKKTDTGSYSESSKEITFGTDKSLPIVNELDDTKPVSAELYFKTKDSEYSFMIENILIEKAY